MNIKLVLPFLTLLAVSYSEDIIEGSNTNGRIIYDETNQASPAIWRQIQNVTVNTTDNEVISRIVITDLRPNKDGDAKIVEGGVGQKSVTIELKSPTVLRGYDFNIQVYSVPESQGIGSDNSNPTKNEGNLPIHLGKPEIQQPKTTPLSTDIKERGGKREVRSPVNDQAHDVIGKLKTQENSTPIPPSLFGSEITTTNPLKATSLDGKKTSEDEKNQEVHTDKPFTGLLGVFNVERSTHIPAPQKDLKTNPDVKRQAVETEKEDQTITQDDQNISGSPAIVGKATTPAPQKDLKTSTDLHRHVRETEKEDQPKIQDNQKISDSPAIVGKAIASAPEKDLKTNPAGLSRQARDTVKEDEIKIQDVKKNGPPAIVGRTIATPATEKDEKTSTELFRQPRDTDKDDKSKTLDNKNNGSPSIVAKPITPPTEKDLKTSTDVHRHVRETKREDQPKIKDDQNIGGSPAIVGKAVTPTSEKDLKTESRLTRQARETEEEDEIKTQDGNKNRSPAIVGKTIATPTPVKDEKTTTELHRNSRDTKKEDTQTNKNISGSRSIVGKFTPAPEKNLKTSTDVHRHVRETEKENEAKTQNDQKFSGSPAIISKAITPATEKDIKSNTNLNRQVRDTNNKEDKTQSQNGQKSDSPVAFGKTITPIPDVKTNTDVSRQARDTEKEDRTKTQDIKNIEFPAIVGKATPVPEKDLKTNPDLTRQVRDAETENKNQPQDGQKSGPPSIVGKAITPPPVKDLKTNTDLTRQARDTKKEDEIKSPAFVSGPVLNAKTQRTPNVALANKPINTGSSDARAASTTEKSRIARDTESETKPDEKKSKVQNQAAEQVSPNSDDLDVPKIAPNVGFRPPKTEATPVSVHRRSAENAAVPPTVAKGPSAFTPTGINSQKAKTDEDSLEDDKITKANGHNEKKPVISIQ